MGQLEKKKNYLLTLFADVGCLYWLVTKSPGAGTYNHIVFIRKKKKKKSKFRNDGEMRRMNTSTTPHRKPIEDSSLEWLRGPEAGFVHSLVSISWNPHTSAVFDPTLTNWEQHLSRKTSRKGCVWLVLFPFFNRESGRALYLNIKVW